MLKAVVDHGGFAQAAAAVFKSQSTVNHAVHKLQDQLGIQLLEVRGRKAHLTAAGDMLLRRTSQLLEQAESLELVAASLNQGEEVEIRLAVDEIFPPECLAGALDELAGDYPHLYLVAPSFPVGLGRGIQGNTHFTSTSNSHDAALLLEHAA